MLPSMSHETGGLYFLTNRASSLSLRRSSPLAHARSRPRCIPRLCSPSQARLTFSLILRRASNTEIVTEQQGKRNTRWRAGKHQQNAMACLPLGLSGRIKLGRPC